MTWPLPYPLGGAASERRERYERTVKQVVPPWLRRRVGGSILSGIGAVMDAITSRAGDAVRLRFPGVDEDALPIIGQERRIVRGPMESSYAYSQRLPGWIDAHRRRGSVYAMLEQWHGYNADSPRRIDIVYQSGTRYVLAADGTITRDTSPGWVPDASPLWARAWAFVYEGSDPGTPSAVDAAALTVIPRLWTAAHMRPITVVILWPGVELWDYPPGIWDEPGALWADDVPYILEAA